MKEKGVLTFLLLLCAFVAYGQIEVRTEAQVTASDGDHTPLWLNANKYGLSSLEQTNGYVRAGAFLPVQHDSLRQWKRGFGVDLALASEFTSTLIVQQLYGELSWKKGLLTIGSKEQPLELKSQELSSGSQTLGINARPVPGIRIELPEYWTIPGVKWLGLKGHIFYGMTTDDRWQKHFTHRQSKYTENTMLHTKAGFFRIGNPEKPLTVELGLEMGCQFGGRSYRYGDDSPHAIENESGLKGMIHAFIPGGGEATDVDYRNEMGNHVGSWVARVNLDYEKWGASLYADHYFEDQSQMFFLDYDGYGTGDNWDKWESFDWMLYDLRDIMLGAEVRLKQCKWVNSIVAEYLYTKYQSGPLYHDHTKVMPDHVGGLDGYYMHSIFAGWHHWGQVMGNPLYRSPLYNTNDLNSVEDNRFVAWHFGINGTPTPQLHYRLMATWQKGYGTYWIPYIEPRHNFSFMAEAEYKFDNKWSVKGAFGLDRGKLLGDNTGCQITVAKRFDVKIKK